MYIETKFYDNGKCYAKLHKGFGYPQLEDDKRCDRYIESIGKHNVQTDYDNTCDYDSLESWIEDNLLIETDDIIDFVITLESGEWVEITNFC